VILSYSFRLNYSILFFAGERTGFHAKGIPSGAAAQTTYVEHYTKLNFHITNTRSINDNYVIDLYIRTSIYFASHDRVIYFSRQAELDARDRPQATDL